MPSPSSNRFAGQKSTILIDFNPSSLSKAGFHSISTMRLSTSVFPIAFALCATSSPIENAK